MKGRILVVDDEQAMCELLEAGMAPMGFEITWRLNGAEALEVLQQDAFDVLLTDLNMRGMTGLQLCAHAHQIRPDMPVVVLTAFGSMQTAVEAIRAGAYDFVTKPVEMSALALVLQRAVEHRRLGEELRMLRSRAEEGTQPQGLIGDSPAIREVLQLIPRAATSDVSVLVTGETGTGKEVIARALHRASGVSGPFVPVNCSAIPEALMEAELFGHTKGAFTDARRARPGLFAEAQGGTLFLDEVGDLPLAVQPKLLRALQEHRIRPVGADSEVDVDCRIIAATHRDLKREVDAGTFRADLFYRLAVIRMEVPPLRARAGDVLLLAQHFIDRAAARCGRRVMGMTTPFARDLLGHDWPGNVRELENCMERAVALTQHDRLVVADLPEELRSDTYTEAELEEPTPEGYRALADVEQRHILQVLQAVDGNKSIAARILGLDRRTLYRKLERYKQTDDGLP